MIGELVRIAGQCDGVRCDMAMLVLPEVFERTWGIRAELVLAEGDRSRARASIPDFCFMAEVYWDLEWTMQQQGFDYAYDKRLYDRLREATRGRCASTPRRARLPGQAGPLPREPRRAARGRHVPPGVHGPPPSSPSCHPGLRFFHQGQFEGAGSASRRPPRPRPRCEAPERRSLQRSTTACSQCSEGPGRSRRRLAAARSAPAWEGNWTSDCFIAWSWSAHAHESG